MTASSLDPVVSRYYPSPGEAPGSLVVILHGVGSSAAAMSPLADRILHGVPGALIVAPDAPHRFDGGGPGRQWFSVSGVTEVNRPSRISDARPTLRAFLNQELVLAGLGWDRLAVVGFSQGAMMALALATEPEPPAVVVAIAGRLASPIAETALRRPSVLILHGDHDAVVPVSCAEQAASALATAGFPVDLEIAAGHGHGISNTQAERIMRHLKQWLAPGASARAA